MVVLGNMDELVSGVGDQGTNAALLQLFLYALDLCSCLNLIIRYPPKHNWRLAERYALHALACAM